MLKNSCINPVIVLDSRSEELLMLRLLFLALFIIVVWIWLLPIVMPNRERKAYDDEALRRLAHERGIWGIPQKLSDLSKLYKDANNSLTKEKVQLGRALFFDENLSSDGSVSCARCHMLSYNSWNKEQFLDDITHPGSKTDCMVCHIQDESGTDRLATPIGAQGRSDPYHRNTLTVLNASLAKYQLWDGSSKNTLTTIKKMFHDPYRMNISQEELLHKVSANEEYKKQFVMLFDDGVTFYNIQKTLDSYLKTLVTRSAFDAFLDGNNSAMSEEAKRGFRNFIEIGCNGCHAGRSLGGQTVQKFPTRDYNYIINVTSAYDAKYIGRRVGSFEFNFQKHHDFPFENKGGFLGAKQQRLFRVPNLRNVTKTSPYFHNGAVFDLREAIYIMAKYQLSVELTDQQVDELVAFFKSLEGEVVDYEELR